MPLPPDRPATHEPLDLEVVWDLSDRIDEVAVDATLRADQLDALAAAEGQPRAAAWVAASVDPDLTIVRDHAACIHICTGGCQAWGSVDVLVRLLELRDARVAAGKPAFDILPLGCLDMCDRPTAAWTSGPAGDHRHADLDPEAAEDVVKALLDD